MELCREISSRSGAKDSVHVKTVKMEGLLVFGEFEEVIGIQGRYVERSHRADCSYFFDCVS